MALTGKVIDPMLREKLRAPRREKAAALEELLRKVEGRPDVPKATKEQIGFTVDKAMDISPRILSARLEAYSAEVASYTGEDFSIEKEIVISTPRGSTTQVVTRVLDKPVTEPVDPEPSKPLILVPIEEKEIYHPFEPLTIYPEPPPKIYPPVITPEPPPIIYPPVAPERAAPVFSVLAVLFAVCVGAVVFDAVT